MNSLAKSVMRPLVERHVGDAAFYWQQVDGSLDSPLLNRQALAQFERLLVAHLDGLRVAGGSGWQLALEALQRWKGAGESFVCATLALEKKDDVWLQAVFDAMQKAPASLLRGLIGAALRLPQAVEIAWQWSRAEEPVLKQTAAWRVLARWGELAEARFQSHFEAALSSPDKYVRAAACRASPCFQQADRVVACLNDPSEDVVAEAAIGLMRVGNMAGREKLQKILLDTLAGSPSLRRARHLAAALPPGSADIMEELLACLPPRLMLYFILHHGDPVWLSFVREQMHNPECARYAGWVWAAITGIDIEANNLWMPETDTEYLTDMLDPGLPMPNAQVIASLNLPLENGSRVLLGKTLRELDCLSVLDRSPQILRWIAARQIEEKTGVALDVCAPLRRQDEVMARLAR